MPSAYSKRRQPRREVPYEGLYLRYRLGSKGGLKLTPFQVMGANHYKSKDTRAVSQDIEINVGSVFSSWNPASHSDYWTDDDLTIPIAQFLSRLLLQ